MTKQILRLIIAVLFILPELGWKINIGLIVCILIFKDWLSEEDHGHKEYLKKELPSFWSLKTMKDSIKIIKIRLEID